MTNYKITQIKSLLAQNYTVIFKMVPGKVTRQGSPVGNRTLPVLNQSLFEIYLLSDHQLYIVMSFELIMPFQNISVSKCTGLR